MPRCAQLSSVFSRSQLLHFLVVGYEKLGRKLGVGTRVAAKMIRQRARNGTSAAPSPSPATARPSSAASQSAARVERPPAPRRIDPRTATRNVTRGVARGSRGFGRGFWTPFAHASRALWHEITGVFFAIFAIFFGQGLWHHRDAWRSGPEHTHFIIYLVITLLFIYFSISAFVTSRRSQR